MTIYRRNTEILGEKSVPVSLFLPPIPSGVLSTEPSSKWQETVARTTKWLPSALVFIYIYHIHPFNVLVRALQWLHKPASKQT
jgi:hypothetical protein